MTTHAVANVDKWAVRPRRGFSLIELLVVVSIIVLLVALMVPALARTRHASRMTVCASRIRQIDQAFLSRKNALHQQGQRQEKTHLDGWPSSLLPYLGGEGEVLICPEDGEVSGGAANIIVECILNGSHYFDTNLDEGPLNAKLSTTQFDEAGLRESKKNWNPPGYVPDGNPQTWYICIEDIRPGGGDRDFEDMVIRVTEMRNGLELHFKRGATNRRFNVLDLNRVEIIHDASNQTIFIEGGSSSYGVNVNWWRNTGGRVVQAMDYESTAINAAGPLATDVWDDEEDATGRLIFARHFGGMNVLWSDGSVEASVNRADIDPAIGPEHEALWSPDWTPQ